MEPIFSLPYSEFAVMQELSRYFKKDQGFSAYVPTSRQQKGVDFLIHSQKTNKCARFQVKASQSYPRQVYKNQPYRHSLWFSNFLGKYVDGFCDFYCLFGLYPPGDLSSGQIDANKGVWQPLLLCLTDSEMKEFLQSVKTKKEPKKPDRFFYVVRISLKSATVLAAKRPRSRGQTGRFLGANRPLLAWVG